LDEVMIGIHPDCPPSVALLADHLDAALAAGEDLLMASLPPRADLDEIDSESAPEALDAFVRRLLQLEASLLLRVLQARRLAVEIGRADPALKAAGALFRAQTDTLHELILRAGRTPEGALVRAGDSHAYLRSRGMIAPEAAAPSPFESLSVGEGFRVGGIVVLSQILDLVSSVLDLLDARFGLYGPEVAAEDGPSGAAAGESSSPSDPDLVAPALGTVIAAMTGRRESPVETRAPEAGVVSTEAAESVDEQASRQPLIVVNEVAGDTKGTVGIAEATPVLSSASDGDATAAKPGVPDEASSAGMKSPQASRSLVSLVAEIGSVS